MCTNTIGAIAGYSAFLNNGQAVMMADAEADEKILVNITGTYMPDYIFLPKKLYALCRDYHVVTRLCDYVLVKTKFKSDEKINNELALLLPTSGTTGSNKYVRISYKNLISNAESIIEYLQIDEHQKTITTLPMNYSFGLSIINSYLTAGATIVVTEHKIYRKEFWELVKRENITSISGVPYTYEMLERLGFMNINIPSLRVLTQAGGKLSLELQKKFAEYSLKNNIRFYIMYGQTEATARMTYLPDDKLQSKPGSVGIPIPGGKVILTDGNGKEIREAGALGEIVYFGANVSLGYADNRKDLVKGDENYGELHTGDMAVMDKDGYLYIKGRKKRFVKLYGRRISLDDLERHLSSKFQDEIYCSGDDSRIEVYLLINCVLPYSSVQSYTAKYLNVANDIIHIVYISEVPRNKNGKVMYAEMHKKVIEYKFIK